jgi:hypothetical protein
MTSKVLSFSVKYSDYDSFLRVYDRWRRLALYKGYAVPSRSKLLSRKLKELIVDLEKELRSD